MSSDTPTGIDRLLVATRPESRFQDGEMYLWTVVIAALFGDIASTWYGIEQGFREANPLARVALETFGYPGMVALKGAALAGALACRRTFPDRFALLVPATLGGVWSAAVVVNLAVILTVA